MLRANAGYPRRCDRRRSEFALPSEL